LQRLARGSTGPPLVRPHPTTPPPETQPSGAVLHRRANSRGHAGPQAPHRLRKPGAPRPLPHPASTGGQRSAQPAPRPRALRQQARAAVSAQAGSQGRAGRGLGEGQARLMKWQRMGWVRVTGPQKWHAPRVRAPRRGNGGRSGSVHGRSRLPGAQAAPAPRHRQTAHVPRSHPQQAAHTPPASPPSTARRGRAFLHSSAGAAGATRP